MTATDEEYETWMRLQAIADEGGVDVSWLRSYLQEEIDRRRREQYSMHARAAADLDRRFERLE
jgi:hypothetical protein